MNTGASALPFLTPQVSNIPMMSKVKNEVIPLLELQPLTSTQKPKDAETRVGPPFMKSSSGAKIKSAKYDGTVHWTEFKAPFDACAEINGETDKEKGLYLAVSFRGHAQGSFGNLASKSSDYTELSNALEERFALPNQTELYRVQLKERRQRAIESLAEPVQDI